MQKSLLHAKGELLDPIAHSSRSLSKMYPKMTARYADEENISGGGERQVYQVPGAMQDELLYGVFGWSQMREPCPHLMFKEGIVFVTVMINLQTFS